MPRIFIVDDDEFILKSLTRVLRRPGYDIVGFGSPEDILERIGEGPDLVICDFHLPRIDGLSVVAQAKNANPRTRTMILSGGIADDDVTAALDKGSLDRFVTKPWHHDELVGVVSELLAR